MKVRQVEFVGSFPDVAKLPKRRLQEIAFAGRSNVGKSSMINSLLTRKNLARTSGTPGKTRQLNYILINDAFYFVDLPGYGFAKVPRAERERWARLIDRYIENNPYLRLLVSIIDIRHGPTETDLELLRWITHFQIETVVVATKADKLNRAQLQKAEARITAAIETMPVHGPIFFSAQSGLGKPQVWQIVESFLE